MRIIRRLYIPLIAMLLWYTKPAGAEVTKVDVPIVAPSIDGIDVSAHQQTIDWEAVARDKRVKFVYVKATEGATYTSRAFRYNLENARRVGLKVGSYHFLRTGSRIRDQFENFARAVKKNEQDLLPLIDVEVRQGWTNQQVRDSVKLFADLCEKHFGVRPMIYTSSHFFNNILGCAFADYPLFIARYSDTEPSLNCGKWILWQYSEKGRVPGVPTAVDVSCFNKGCGLQDILIKENQIGSRRRSAAEVVDTRDKPGTVRVKEAPTMSKAQEKELRKQQEKEQKARERAEKLKREEEAKKAERERKAAEKRRKEELKQQEAEAKKQKKLEEEARKRDQANRKEQEHQRELQHRVEQERLKAEQERIKAEQEQIKAEERMTEQEERKIEQEERKAEQEQRKAEMEQRQREQQEQKRAAKQEKNNKIRQQRETMQRNRLANPDTTLRHSTRTRKANKSSADND